MPETHETETAPLQQSWFARLATHAHAKVWLAVISFTESSVFVIPPDPLLALLIFARREQWIRYTIITVVASIAGAIFGYALGAIAYDLVGARIVDFYNLEAPMARAVELVHNGVFVFTLTMAFTPIPFKVAVLAAGFTKAHFLAFLLAAIGGRIARYAFVAIVARVFTDNFTLIMRRFWWFATGAGVLVLGAYALYRIFF